MTATEVAAATAWPTIVAEAVATIEAIGIVTAVAETDTNRDTLAKAYLQSQPCEDVMLEYRTTMSGYTTGGILTFDEARDFTLLQLASSFGAGTVVPIHVRDISARIIECQEAGG